MTTAPQSPSNALPATDSQSRRDFLKKSAVNAAGAIVATEFPFVLTSHAAPDDPIRIGLVGCGGRGTGAVLDALGAATKVVYPRATYHTEDAVEGTQVSVPNVKVVALADVFPDRLDRCRKQLAKVNMPVSDDGCFVGFDAYQKVMTLPEVNYVILATPPQFRPVQLRAAIQAGKHAFVEKPVAVDAAGVRSVIESGELARRKGLSIVAGTMFRRETGSRETVRRIRQGMIGELIACEAIWSGGELWVVERQPNWSDMEYQLRNWLYYTWLSGDFIVEQFVHNLDIIRWVLEENPSRAFGLGGRQVRTDPQFGNIYDHFAVEYQFPSGVRCFALDRHTDGSTGRIEQVFLGSKGQAQIGLFGPWSIQVKGGEPWRFTGKRNNPYHQEHAEMIHGIRTGQPLNEARQVAESTLMAIMGRETAYSGKMIEWEEALNSKQDLTPAKLELGPMPMPPVAMPGKYQLS